MSILKFECYDDVIKRANNTHFGLGAGVVTKDCKFQNKILQKMIIIECFLFFNI